MKNMFSVEKKKKKKSICCIFPSDIQGFGEERKSTDLHR